MNRKGHRTRRVLCLFDYRATTGFATVSQNLVTQLHRHFGGRLYLDIVAINYFGIAGIEQEDEYTRVIRVSQGEIAKDPFCRMTFLWHLNNGDYDGYFIIQDMGIAIGMLPNLMEIDKNRSSKGWRRLDRMFYFPVDAAPLHTFFEHEKNIRFQDFADAKLGEAYLRNIPRQRRSLGFFDRLITYTEYGRSQIVQRAPWLGSKLSVIPHGINAEEFYLLSHEERHRLRRELFGLHADKFIVVNVNRNQFRKDIPKTLAAFRRWQQLVQSTIDAGKQGFCYLHMHPDDPMGWDLRHVAEQLGMEEGTDYGFPPEPEWNAGASIDTLRAIYNAADVFVTTTTGEGWGLTIHEAMACGTTVVAPRHTAIIELGNLDAEESEWRLEAVPSYFGYCDTTDNVWRQEVNIEEVAQKLLSLSQRAPYKHGKREQSAAAYARSLNWKAIGHQWKIEFEKLFFS